MSCVSVLLCVQTSSFSVFIYKTLGFSLGSRSEHSSLFCFFSSHDSFSLEENKSLPSLCVFFGGGFSSMSLLLLITHILFFFLFFFLLEMNLRLFYSVVHNPHLFFFSFFFPPPLSDLLMRLRVSTEFERNGRLEGSR